MEQKLKLGSEWSKPQPCGNETCSFFGKGVCADDCKPEAAPVEPVEPEQWSGTV